MKRVPLTRKTPLRSRRIRQDKPAATREPHPMALVPSVKPRQDVTYGGGTSGVPVLKGPEAKPGKRAPTKDEAAWMDALIAHGCICCRQLGYGYVAPEIHHILRGGVRMGHKFTLPLCTSHHRGGALFNSRHPWKQRFTDAYGDEWALLSTLQGVLKKQKDGSYAP